MLTLKAKKISLIIGVSILLVLTSSPSSFANNLSITNVSLEDRDIEANTVVVEFDITWDNSWRDATNYDAVWIILKVSKNANTNLAHGYMDACGVDPVDTSPGSNKDLLIDVPCNDTTGSGTSIYTGAFIYRRFAGTGTIDSKNVRLVMDYTASPFVAGDTDTLAVTIVGIEMVYIPEGPFQAGDGAATGAFWQRAATGEKHPWYISSEDEIVTTDGSSGSFYYQSTGSNIPEFSSGAIFTIYANYPKGFHEFYCMKYEITEGQWLVYFNNIASAAQTARDITTSGGGSKNSDGWVWRNTIAWTSGDATSDRPNRAMSYLNWIDFTGYLDWVALRPMTELEYEKVARGKGAAIPHEYAWGSSTITAAVTFSKSPEDGTETITTASANAVYDNTTFSQGDDFLAGGQDYVRGPVRSGIFATDSSTRESSGAGYWGVMDLSGNLGEWTVSVGNTTATTFFNVNGDGSVTGAGVANQLGWVEITNAGEGSDGVTDETGSGVRGGAFNNPGGPLEVSDRSEAADEVANRRRRYGGRGVRSVTPATYPTCGNATLEPPEQCDGGAALGSCPTNCDANCFCTEGGG